jgi:hypothetical protein
MADLQHFRSTLRRDVDHWEDRLSNVLQQNGLAQPRSSPNKEEESYHSARHIRVRKELAELQESLDSLQIHYLSTNLLDGDNLPHDSRRVERTISHDLPMEDAKALHSEFAQCVSQLEQAESLLVPKTKFVFQRYRKACQDQRQKTESLGERLLAQENEEPTEKKSMTATSCQIVHHVGQVYNPLANKSHASILVSDTGEVVISDNNAELECGAHDTNAKSFLGVGSLHIHNVHHSTMHL